MLGDSGNASPEFTIASNDTMESNDDVESADTMEYEE